MTLHADALTVLRGWPAPSPDQEALRARYVRHLETHDDGLERSCFPDHLTAGTLVVSSSGQEVLLNLHRKAQRWFAFGGHLEPGDGTLADGALREAREESGLPDVEIHPEPVHLDEHAVGFCGARGEVHHLDVRFAGRAPSHVRPAASQESLDVRWWPVAALPSELEDDMRVLIRLARAHWLGPSTSQGI